MVFAIVDIPLRFYWVPCVSELRDEALDFTYEEALVLGYW